MIVILDDKGLPDWNLTSQMLRSDHITWLGQYMKTMNFRSFDFGAGPELAFQCPGCGRWCPHATAPVDHIIPRTKIRFTVLNPHPFLKHIKFTGISYELTPLGMFSILSAAHHPVPVVQTYDLKDSKQDIWYYYHNVGPLYPIPGAPQPIRILHRIRIKGLLENDIENLQFMCASCNSKKSNNIIAPGQFRPQLVGNHQLIVR